MKKNLNATTAQPEMPEPNDDFETEGHLRTLMDAEKIKADPEKMTKVHALAKKHKKAISSITDLRRAFNAKVKQEQEPSAQDESQEEEQE